MEKQERAQGRAQLSGRAVRRHAELCNLRGVVTVWLKDPGKVTLGIATSLPAPAPPAAFWERTVTQNALSA